MCNTEYTVILDILVNNHPGSMAHVTGLFSRRAFNVEAILCLPVDGSDVSRIWLLVNDDEQLEQMIRQMRKLQDVHEVLVRNDTHVFDQLQQIMDG